MIVKMLCDQCVQYKLCFVRFDGKKLKAKDLKNFFYIKQENKKYLIVNHCHCAAFFVSFLGLTKKERKIIDGLKNLKLKKIAIKWLRMKKKGTILRKSFRIAA